MNDMRQFLNLKSSSAWMHSAFPEHITERFPTLSLADFYGVVTYYLDRQQELETHFARLAEEYEQVRLASRAECSEFYNDLRRRTEAWRMHHPVPPQEPLE